MIWLAVKTIKKTKWSLEIQEFSWMIFIKSFDDASHFATLLKKCSAFFQCPLPNRAGRQRSSWFEKHCALTIQAGASPNHVSKPGRPHKWVIAIKILKQNLFNKLRLIFETKVRYGLGLWGASLAALVLFEGGQQRGRTYSKSTRTVCTILCDAYGESRRPE